MSAIGPWPTFLLWHIREDYGLRAMSIGYGDLHATIASGRVRLSTDGGANIARYALLFVRSSAWPLMPIYFVEGETIGVGATFA